MNMHLFNQVEITKYLLSFGEITTILFIYIRFIALHLKVSFYFNYYKYIVWLEISTRKYASRYEKLYIKKILNLFSNMMFIIILII